MMLKTNFNDFMSWPIWCVPWEFGPCPEARAI